MSVSLIEYGFSGGRYRKKNMTVTIYLEDNLDPPQPVPDVVVSVDINLDDSNRHWLGSGTTGVDGSVAFKVIKSDPGCYTTTVTGVSDDRWDAVHFVNGACK